MGKSDLAPIVFILLAVAALVVSFSYLASTLLPVLIALLLAYAFDPLVGFFEKRGVGRSISIILVFCAVFLLFTSLSAFFVTSIKGEFQNVRINLPDYADRFYAWIPPRIKGHLGIETPERFYQRIEAQLESLRGISFELFKETFTIVKRAFASTLAFILAVIGYFITPIYLYYFLKDLHRIESGILDLVPERYRQGFITRAGEINEVLSAFVRGQLTLVLILSILYSIGLYFIGIDLAVVIGTLAGITFIIPYFGTILGIVLSILMALLKFHDLLHPVLCLGWFILVQLAEGGFITPRVVGGKVGLHPVVTILSLLVGGQLFGLVGMLLAVPVAAILKVFYRSLLESYHRSAYFLGE